MSRGPAHRLLAPRLPARRSSAWLVMVLLSSTPLACLAPPGGRLPPEFPNYPPEIDGESVRPRAQSIAVGALPQDGVPCNPVFEARVRDLDEDTMRFRCILDNKSSRARVVPFSEGERSGASGFVNVFCRVLSADLDFSRSTEAEIMTLVITDAPAFVHSSTVTSPAALDYTAIDEDPDADEVADHGVVSTSWAITKNPGGQECP